MTWSCGIVGLPNAGKSTLFRALTALDVTIESYPFSTINPNKAVVPLPDPRLTALAKVCGSSKVTPATIEIIDVAGLVKGASKGEGLGNQFLGNLREVDLLIHVVAGFNAELVSGSDRVSQIETVNLELCLSDLESLFRRRQKVEPKVKSGDKEALLELHLLARLEEHLNQGKPLRECQFHDEELHIVKQLSLLTNKEMVYVFNTDENSFLKPDISFFPSGSVVIPMCARLEAELVDLDPDEREPFLVAYGINENQTSVLLEQCYRKLKLITFYTVKGDEARAWIVPESTNALQAAGKIHTDMEKGFINVEVIPWDLMCTEGSLVKIREKGLGRVEGKNYQVHDGDVLFIRFRV